MQIRQKRRLALFMLGVTVLVAGHVPAAKSLTAGRRFLAVENSTGHRLVTVITDSSTNIIDPSPLYAGLRVRVYGIRNGRTIRARRIEVMH